MDQIKESPNKNILVPIIVDVKRNIDGYQMIRCSYFSVQSDEPLPNWNLKMGEVNSPILLINLEAIIVGAPNNSNKFNNYEDIIRMYNNIEKYDALFIDINDIWVPIEWFGIIGINQGMVFRIPQDRFSLCWKLRNDKISIEEMFEDENILDERIKSKLIERPPVRFSEGETFVFKKWTEVQIDQSRENYKNSKGQEKTLKKINNEPT